MTTTRVILGEGEKEYRETVKYVMEKMQKIEKTKEIKKQLSAILDPMVKAIGNKD